METISALHNAICYLDGAYSKVKDRRIEVHSSNSGEYGDKTGKYIRSLIIFAYRCVYAVPRA